LSAVSLSLASIDGVQADALQEAYDNSGYNNDLGKEDRQTYHFADRDVSDYDTVYESYKGD
jgi:hypothetical protein